jgi:hypothetical protein
MNNKWQVILLFVIMVSVEVSAGAEDDGPRIYNPPNDTIFYCNSPVAVAPGIAIQNIQSKNASEGIKISVVNYQKGYDTLIYYGEQVLPQVES